jgi:hypothetical protein
MLLYVLLTQGHRAYRFLFGQTRALYSGAGKLTWAAEIGVHGALAWFVYGGTEDMGVWNER